MSIRALKRFVTEKYGVESLAPDAQDGLFEGENEAGNKWRWHLPVQIQTRKNIVKNNKGRDLNIEGVQLDGAIKAIDYFGLYHLTGNVVEWTQSTNRPYNRERQYVDDDRNHDDTVGLRVTRGDSWYSASIAILYIPYRDAFQPEHSTQDIGFRLVAKLLP